MLPWHLQLRRKLLQALFVHLLYQEVLKRQVALPSLENEGPRQNFTHRLRPQLL